MKTDPKIRYAYDIGANSIGWAVYKDKKLIDVGVMAFSDSRDPKDGSSLASKRREPRGQRRRRDRYLERRKKLMAALVDCGLMPADPVARKNLEALDPYQLRAAALDDPLSPHEIGRAIFHLNQRRGFKSNRKTDNPDDSGPIKQAASHLCKAIKAREHRSLGEHLNWKLRDEHGALRREDGPGKKPIGGVRARLRGQGKTASYDLYATRKMLEDEFDEIWKAQQAHHQDILTPEAREKIRDIIFFQRPLKPVEPGRCTFFPDEKRAPSALPLIQHLRIYQEANHLKFSQDKGITWRKITVDERDIVANTLLKQKSLTWGKMRTILNLDADTQINLATSQRGKELKGDETAAAMRHKDRFSKTWDSFDPQRQDAIIKYLIEAEKDEDVITWLMAEQGLDQVQAEQVAVTSLPKGHSRLCETAAEKILAALKNSSRSENGHPCPLTYSQAVEQGLGRGHADFNQGGNLPYLPYYGHILERYVAFGTGNSKDPVEKRCGRIANPSVHVALNQLRKLVNNQMRVYGPPHEIILELARELKLNDVQKNTIEARQKTNREANEKRKQKLAEQGKPDTSDNLLLLRLWEELNPDDCKDRRCPYTGKQISIHKLFSGEIEIDHILPFSQSLDDTPANRTLCYRAANRAKTNKSPYEAFGTSPNIGGESYNWSDIAERAGKMPHYKRWRFAPDAMDRMAREGDFLGRHLTDTRYSARLAREYLTAICPPEKIWVTPGPLTGMLVRKMELGSIIGKGGAETKNRNDYRHNAIDAAVIGLIDRGYLNEVTRHISSQEGEETGTLRRTIRDPYLEFRRDLTQAVHRLIVAHKPDHGKRGQLHDDTAYGLVRHPELEHEPKAPLVRRKPLTDLTDKEIGLIRDDDLRKQVQEVTAGLSEKERKLALEKFSEESGIRRVRLLKPNTNYLPIKDRQGHAYKAVITSVNHHMDIFSDGEGTWHCEAVSVFDANRPSPPPPSWQADPQNRLVMRVHKGDLIELDRKDGEGREVYRVAILEISNKRLVFVPHYAAGNLGTRHKDPKDSLRWDYPAMSKLKSRRPRQVRIDLLGRDMSKNADDD